MLPADCKRIVRGRTLFPPIKLDLKQQIDSSKSHSNVSDDDDGGGGAVFFMLCNKFRINSRSRLEPSNKPQSRASTLLHTNEDTHRANEALTALYMCSVNRRRFESDQLCAT